jgi:tyrosyl-tRNA synthetase
LDEATLLDVFKDVPQFSASRDALSDGIPVIELLATHTRFAASKGEARTLLQGGGIAVNKHKVDLESSFTASDLLNDRYLLLQRGKKTYALVTFG